MKFIRSIGLFIILLSFVPLFTCAQGISDVGGRIVTDKQEAVPYCNLILSKVSDTLDQKLVQTNVDGYFYFKGIAYGIYLLKTFQSGCSQIDTLNINSPQIKIESIILKPCITQLKNVEVTGRPPIIERKIDRVVFNAKNSILGSSTNLWDALKVAPNVRTQQNGNVQVGEKAAIIYIDNVLIQLGGSDLASFLQSYSASKLDKIEIFEIPPANYDANGGAVINIITKKTKSDGLYGDASINYEQSSYPKINTSINLNGKAKKIEYYANLSGGVGKYLRIDQQYVDYLLPSLNSYWDIDNTSFEKRDQYNASIGFKYTPSPGNTIGFQGNLLHIKSTSNAHIFTGIENNGTIDSTIKTINDYSYNARNISLNEYYKKALDTIGGAIQFSAAQLIYHNLPIQTLQSNTLNKNQANITEYQNNSNSPQDITIFTGQVDLNKSFKKIQLDAGIKGSFIKTNTDFSFESTDTSQVNNFLYKENNFAMYASATRQWKMITVKIGVRAEYTDLEIHSISTKEDSLNTQNYLKLFPTAYFQYEIDKNNLLILSSNRRISRPGYDKLNPFTYYATPYYVTSGNPYLKPALEYSTQLDYILNNRYTFSIFYNQARNRFTNITEQNDQTKVFKDMQQNIGKGSSLGTSLYFDIEPMRNWQMSNYIRLSYKTESSDYLNNEYSFHKFICYYSLDNTFTLSKDKSWVSEVHFYYLTPTIQGIYNNDKMYDLSIGVRKKIKNVSISLNMNDIFYSNFNKIDVNYLNQHNGFVYKTDTRSVVLSVRYSFNRKDNKNKDVEINSPTDRSDLDRVNNGK
ncbi:outer membrane beta-barrel protein [Chitinophaga sp. 30R24]|uniref:outer membrane beta-barrel protein n=1 Tax=Chitinophaga sp. 30R24 TaxID=3248838 RepID=UPI003B917D57